MGGIIINESLWPSIDKSISYFKLQEFGSDYEKVELHLSAIMHGKGYFKNIKINERMDLVKRLFKLISEFNFRIVAAIIKKNKIYENVRKDIELWAFRLFFERL